MGNKRVLVVDDAMTMRQLVSFTLSDAGFEVFTAQDADQGMKELDRVGEVSLVVTDLNMPGMDGIEFIKAIRARIKSRFTPVVMLTTESQEARKTEAIKAGATCWIVKPFTPENLVAVVRKHAR